jgi:hypothetical protein
MIIRMLLCLLAIMALQLSGTEGIWAQQSGSMIVVFRVEAAFDNFRE